MAGMNAARIAGTGYCLPERTVTSAELECSLGLEAGWIVRRTGIVERRYATEQQSTSSLAAVAAEGALQTSGVAASDIGLLLLATSTPDHLLPPTAPLLAHRLGCGGIGAMDLAGACTGFIYALSLADAWVRVNGRPALVVAANTLSRRLDWSDRASAALFADGAGAVVLTPGRDARTGVLSTHLSSAGRHYDLIKIEAGGAVLPFGTDTTAAERSIRISDGRAAFALAVDAMADASGDALTAAGVGVADLDWWVPHQANARLIEATRRKLGIDVARTASTIATFGNSSAATIPMALASFVEQRQIRPGHLVLMSAAGAGFTSGAAVVRL